MDNYKDECMKRFEYSKSYEKYSQEDLIDELYEKDIQNEDLQQRIDKAIEYLESLMNSEVFSLERDNNAFEGLDKKQVAKNEVVLSMLKTQTLLNILKGDDINE